MQVGGFDCIESYGLHAGVYHLAEAKFGTIFRRLRVHVSLEIVVGYLISLLIFAVSVTVLLDGVVGKMDDFLSNVI